MHPNELPIRERAETVPFFWPMNRQAPKKRTVETYAAETADDRAAFELVHCYSWIRAPISLAIVYPTSAPWVPDTPIEGSIRQ